MHKPPPSSPAWFLLAAVGLSAGELGAQQPIGHTSATEVQVSGAVEIDHGQTLLGNGSMITAGKQTVEVGLTRGGELRLCSTTSVHLAKDRSIDDPASSALMMALDRGAMEASYSVGTYSDVLLTPDLRILISGPGEARLSVRVNTAGDTCVDNPGVNAPYVTVSSQLEGGAYRVQSGQRVMFEHGSLREVVDHEAEPCGCPAAPVTSVASAGATSKTPIQPGSPVGGPSSTPSDTAFPLAESEGLAAPPAPPTKPVVPAGEAHAEVTVPLTYNGNNSPGSQPGASGQTVTTPASTTPAAAAAPPAAETTVTAAPAVAAPAPSPAPHPPKSGHGFFHGIGHFFARLFR